jgi:hypothetical protein
MKKLIKRKEQLLGYINATEITIESGGFNLKEKLAHLESLCNKLRSVNMEIELIK